METREDGADLVEVIGEGLFADDSDVIDVDKDEEEVLEEFGEVGLKNISYNNDSHS